MPKPATAPQPVLIRAAIYCRISRDDQGDMLAVGRQERDARALCKRKGWTPIEPAFFDNDLSAYSGKPRPAYREMLAAIGCGDVDAVVAYDLDRLHRLPRELEEFFDTCQSAGVTRMATVSGDVDLATNDGQLVARIMGAVAKKASDDTSRRLKRKFDEKAELGLPHGGRAFGYEADGMTVNQAEARLLNTAAADVLAGESLAAITRRWNDAGVVTPQRGRPWTGTVVKAVLTNPRHAGLRVHRGEVVGTAAWPAVIERATHERLLAVLRDPARRMDRPARRQAFTGLVRCGTCGEPMTRNSARGAITYRCHKSPGRAGCGKVGITALPLEELMREAVMLRVDGREFAQAVGAASGKGDDAGPVAELAALDHRMTELAEMFAAGEVSRGEWLTAKKSLEARQKAARTTLSRTRATTALDPYAGKAGALRRAWDGLSTDRKRAVLAAVIVRVVVKPATRRGPIFDPDRIDVEWRA